jgi:hypothetical protein
MTELFYIHAKKRCDEAKWHKAKSQIGNHVDALALNQRLFRQLDTKTVLFSCWWPFISSEKLDLHVRIIWLLFK